MTMDIYNRSRNLAEFNLVHCPPGTLQITIYYCYVFILFGQLKFVLIDLSCDICVY